VWFQLVQNIRAKYRVVDSDFYNFNETSFIIGIITPRIVIIRVDRCDGLAGPCDSPHHHIVGNRTETSKLAKERRKTIKGRSISLTFAL
jgi:hypothetical protein